jgi:hypothetical protein
MAPSLVTWPMRKTGVSVVLAKAMSRAVASRICVTVPGALVSSGRYCVWMESMTTAAGLSASAAWSTRVASVSASTWRFGASAPSRSARSFTWRADSSPET